MRVSKTWSKRILQALIAALGILLALSCAGCSKLADFVVRNHTDKDISVLVHWTDSSTNPSREAIIHVPAHQTAETHVWYGIDSDCDVAVNRGNELLFKKRYTDDEMFKATASEIKAIFLDVSPEGMSLGKPTIKDWLTRNPIYRLTAMCCCAPLVFIGLLIWVIRLARKQIPPKAAEPLSE